MARSILIAIAVTLSLTVVVRSEDVTRSDLTIAGANAEILAMQDRGYSIKELRVNSNGNAPKFEIIFAENLPVGRVGLAHSHGELDREITEARRDGRVVFTQLKGYRQGNQVLFAFVTQVRRPGAQFGAMVDIPAPELSRVVAGERQKGARLVDKSTYQAPDGLEYHTAVFLPR